MDRSLSEELARIEKEGKLIDQVSMITLQLRMAAARKPLSTSISFANRAITFFPFFYRSVATKPLFGHENISIQKTIINLERLRGVAETFVRIVRQKEISDDEIFKPSNILPDRVVKLIDNALTEIENLTLLSPAERKRIEGYLQEAKKEALSDGPSWSKLVGALVIVAAITSGLADAPNAAKSIKDAIEYILGSSVEKPLQKFLPPPDPDQRRASETYIA